MPVCVSGGVAAGAPLIAGGILTPAAEWVGAHSPPIDFCLNLYPAGGGARGGLRPPNVIARGENHAADCYYANSDITQTHAPVALNGILEGAPILPRLPLTRPHICWSAQGPRPMAQLRSLTNPRATSLFNWHCFVLAIGVRFRRAVLKRGYWRTPYRHQRDQSRYGLSLHRPSMTSRDYQFFDCVRQFRQMAPNDWESASGTSVGIGPSAV